MQESQASLTNLTIDALILAAEVGRMLGCILATAVTVSQVLYLVDMMGKAAVTPVSSMAAWAALLACMPKSEHQ